MPYTPATWDNVGSSRDGLPANIAACERVAEELPVTCVVCNRPGHNDVACALQRAAYDKVGVEIEGYWIDLSTWRNRTPGRLQDTGNADGTQWELRTAADYLTGCLRQLYDFYPDGTNSSCGMHVHVSFPSGADVSLLANRDFVAFWASEWEAWGKERKLPPKHQFWARLRGDNHFCMPNSDPSADGDAGWLHERGRRYQQLNWSSWGKGYKTLECRMFPMFDDRSDAISAIVKLLSIYDSYLSTVAWEEKAVATVKDLPEVRSGSVRDAVTSMTTVVYKNDSTVELPATGVKETALSAYTLAAPAAPGNKLLPRIVLYQEFLNNARNYRPV